MSSMLFSNWCCIKDVRYDVQICFDEYYQICIQFQLENKKNIHSMKNTNQTIPRKIVLNRIIYIKLNEKFRNELIISYVHISDLYIWSVKEMKITMDSICANRFSSIINKNLSKLKNRPRNLLIFVNPCCGKHKGIKLYNKSILPLFDESNIKVKTIYTEYVNHARDYLMENSFDNYDGILCVGGDGIFSEICFSVLLKTAQQLNIDLNDQSIQLIRPSIRLGIIPAGSTDAIAYGTTGHNDPLTSTLQIITGQSIYIDVATVHNENGFVNFMLTTLAYGFFGDIIQQSDKWRIFGPSRYNLSGFIQFIRNRAYRTQLKIIRPSQKCSFKALIENLDQNFVEETEKSLSNENIHLANDNMPLEIQLEGDYRTINCLNMPCRCAKSKYGMSPSVHLNDGSFDVIVVKRSWRMGLFRFLYNVANDGRSIDDLSNVERYRAIEIVIKPIVHQKDHLAHWSCDGELIQGKQIRVRAHHQILPLFASGINIEQIKQINDQKSKITDLFFNKIT